MMHHRWQGVGIRTALLTGGLALLLVSLLHISSALAQDPLTETYPFYQNDAIANAVQYLQTQQQEDGGIDSFGSGSDPGGTARMVYALNAVGYPTDVIQTDDGTTMIDFLTSRVISYTYAEDTPADDNFFPGRAGLVLAAAVAAGEDPTSFGGVHLIDAINATLQPTGAYSTTATEGFSSGAANSVNQSLVIFGLVSAGQPVPAEATDWLLGQQEAAGSWSGGNIDVTGYGIIALIGSGNVEPTDESIQRAIAFLRSQQTAGTALWNDTSEFGEPANSTGWSMTALATAGYMPVTESWATGGTNPQQALLTLQNVEGVFGKNFVNAYSTLEAFYGLTAQPLYMAPPARAARALSWMAEQQNDDGGWPGGVDSASDPGATIDIVLAFAAAGYDPATVTNGGVSPLDYLEGAADSYTGSASQPNQTGKLMVAVEVIGGDSTNYGPTNLNLLSGLQASYNAGTGEYGTDASIFSQSFAILGLVAAGETVPQSAIDWLLGEQQADGSWGSIDATGIALQALIAAGVSPDDPAIVAAITNLRDGQSATGGWEAFGAFSTNSTAYAIQGLLAAGVDLTGTDWLKQGRSALGVLGSYQKPDGPFVVNWNYAGISEAFNPTADDLFATRQALPALLGSFFPYTDINPATLDTFTPIARGPDPDRTVVAQPFGSFSGDETSVNVTVPFGSDLNGNNEVELEWRVAGGSFTPISATREVGFYSATIDLTDTNITPLDTLEFCASFSDPDGVQNDSTINDQDEICSATTSSIAGAVTNESGDPLAGVTITSSAGDSALTGSDGSYTLLNLASGTYTLTPTLTGYTFDPISRTVSVPPDATGQDFTAIAVLVDPDTFSIAGTITDESGDPLAGVTINANDGSSATTAISGTYTLTGLITDSYTLTPTLTGYTFDPISRTVSVPPDATGQDFTAEAVETDGNNTVYLPLITTSGIANGSPDQNRAGVVVRFSDGTVETDCVSFSEDEITGADLIQRSDLAVEVFESDQFGAAVCKIGDEGCPSDDCFCDTENFWKYFLHEDNSWSGAPVGASSRTVQNGDMDGWQWTAFADEDTTPPDITFAEVCPDA